MAEDNVNALFILGTMIYGGSGKANPREIYNYNNIHQSLEFGYTAMGAPILFASKKTTLNSSGDYVTTETTKPDYLITINFDLKYKLGYEMEFGGGQAFIGADAGFSPILTAFKYSYNYGFNTYWGLSWLKGYFELTNGGEYLFTNNWTDPEESGGGSTNYTYTNYKYGFKFSWYSSDRSPGRHHLILGIAEQGIKTPGEGVMIKNPINNEENSPSFLETGYSGYFLEWKHDHVGRLFIEYFPNYPYTGIKSGNYSGEFSSSLYIKLGYVRSIDWF